jgi:hypothetical protein
MIQTNKFSYTISDRLKIIRVRYLIIIGLLLFVCVGPVLTHIPAGNPWNPEEWVEHRTFVIIMSIFMSALLFRLFRTFKAKANQWRYSPQEISIDSGILVQKFENGFTTSVPLIVFSRMSIKRSYYLLHMDTINSIWVPFKAFKQESDRIEFERTIRQSRVKG